jgi:hypothetical protein
MCGNGERDRKDNAAPAGFGQPESQTSFIPAPTGHRGWQAFQKPELEEHEGMKGMKNYRFPCNFMDRVFRVPDRRTSSLNPGAVSVTCSCSSALARGRLDARGALHALHHFMSFLFRLLETVS